LESAAIASIKRGMSSWCSRIAQTMAYTPMLSIICCFAVGPVMAIAFIDDKPAVSKCGSLTDTLKRSIIGSRPLLCTTATAPSLAVWHMAQRSM